MLNDKTVLITGGTGSFGKRFVQMTLQRYNPRKIIIYSRDEYKQEVLRSLISDEFKEKSRCMRYFIGDVRDRDRVFRALGDVDYVIHAAAMKRVETCEYNPFEAIKTNVHGAQNVVDAAIDKGVKKVVALSTDKAVNPVNLYGATKLLSDKLFVTANRYSGGQTTKFSVVRYGNVAGSRGSVIPIFNEIIASGMKELPITDFEMTRFWITLDQGIELVYKALDESNGGETYISKLPSFKTVDLAKAMLPDCVLKEVGIRPGEKLHEIMVTREDYRYTYEFDKYFIIYADFIHPNVADIKKHDGEIVARNFEYSSDNNSQWLSVNDLKEELSKL